MTRRTRCLLPAALLLANSCDGSLLSRRDSAAARTAIGAIYKNLEQAFSAGDLDTIAQVYAEDAALYIPDAPMLDGRLAIRQAWKANVGSGGNRVRFEIAEVEQRGDRAYELGRFTISGPDGAVLAAGKQIVIWARQPGGGWKSRRGIFNWDVPPKTP